MNSSDIECSFESSFLQLLIQYSSEAYISYGNHVVTEYKSKKQVLDCIEIIIKTGRNEYTLQSAHNGLIYPQRALNKTGRVSFVKFLHLLLPTYTN